MILHCRSVSQYLAIEAVAVSRLALQMPLDAVVDEHPRDRRLGLAFGELELGVLELDDALAEGLALLDIVDRHLERPLDPRHRVDARSAAAPAAAAASAGRSPGLPRARAGARAGTRTSSKNSSEVSLALRPILSRLRPRRKPSTSLGLDDEQRDALGALGGVGLGDDDDEIGELAVGDEGLGAVRSHSGCRRACAGRPDRSADRSRRPARSSRSRRSVRRVTSFGSQRCFCSSEP